MSLIAEVRMAGPTTPLLDALSTVPSMQLHVEQTTAEHSEQPVALIWAEGGDFQTFESAMETDDTVDDVEIIEVMDDRRLYRLRVAPHSTMVLYPAELRFGISRLSVSLSANGVDCRIRLPDRAALRKLQEYCDERNISVTLQGLYEGTGLQSPVEHELSEKQREALEMAVRGGYFAVPREITLEELADQLAISRQAASERVRRGSQLLIANALNVSTDQ